MNKRLILGSVYLFVGLLAVTSSVLDRHVVGFVVGLVVLCAGVWITRTHYG